MKLFKIQILIVLLALPLMSCENEIIPPASEKEIITEISRTWSCNMTEDGNPYTGFDITITSDVNDDTKIIIANFHKSGESVIGYVSRDLIISIPEQQIGNQLFEGGGEISNDYSRIDWDYTIIIETETVIVTGTSTSGGEV